MCVITRGRKKACRDQVGGVKRIYITGNELSGITYDVNGEIDAIDAVTVYQYDLPEGAGSFDENIKVSRENGTVYIEQVASINLFKIRSIDRAEIMLMMRGNNRIFFEDYNGNILLAGLDGGIDVNNGKSSMGKAKADMSGYTLEFLANEKDFAPFVAPFTALPFDNIVTVNVAKEA